MEKQKVIDCFGVIVSALEQVIVAKSDAKMQIESAIEAHGLTKRQGRAIIKAARAKINEKVDDAQQEAEDLIAIVEAIA